MANTPISVMLPDSLRTYVDAQVESGVYGTPSEFLRELIEDDRDRHVSRLEQRLIENLKSEPISFSAEELEEDDFVELCRRKLAETR